MSHINITDEDTIFDYLLSRKQLDIDESYISSINILENDVSNFINNNKLDNLMDIPRNFNNTYTWINTKYAELVKLHITIDLITDNIISFYEKKTKLKSHILNIDKL